MATIPHSTTSDRVTFHTPDGRVTVIRHGPRDFGLYLDGVYVQSYDYSYQAEHEGGVWLHEQTVELAAQLADEAVMLDAARDLDRDRNTTFDHSPHTTMRFCPA